MIQIEFFFPLLLGVNVFVNDGEDSRGLHLLASGVVREQAGLAQVPLITTN